jgi:NAD(P)H-flavin reductase
MTRDSVNPYQPIKAEIKEVIEETPSIKTFVLRPRFPIRFETGQFIELTVPGVGEGPFTPSSSPELDEKMEVTIMKVGTMTSALHEMERSEWVGLRGPFGLGYPLGDFVGKEILIVGGGVGLAPLRSLFFALVHRLDSYERILFCYGARTPSDIVYKNAILKEWQNLDPRIGFRITVDRGDDSWKGNVGLVTTTLDNLDVDIPSSVAVVCGPPIMMKFSTFKLIDLGYKPEQIYLSMEKNMSCGIGKCGHCQLGKYYVCRDGPVFTYDQIVGAREIWD